MILDTMKVLCVSEWLPRGDFLSMDARTRSAWYLGLAVLISSIVGLVILYG